MPEKLRPSFNVTEETVKELKKLIPEVFKDGLLDFEALQDALSGYSEDIGTDDKHFGLYWPGKKEAKKAATIPARGSLIPVPGDGVNEDTTKNIYIEGDNLEVLKLLQKSYASRIKMIYIDPPYNTGEDFIYKDDFSETIEEYWLKTGQMGESGIVTTTNKSASGRFHSNWCSMMYPRLRLARDFLSDDGIIFISIDGNEVAQLLKICDEIFGEENFVGLISRATGTTTGQDANRFGSSLDYLLVYCKSSFKLSGIDLSEKDIRRFNHEDARGKYSLLQMRKTGNSDRREDRPTMYYPVISPNGKQVFPMGPTGYESNWRFGVDTYKEYLSKDMIVWQTSRNGEIIPYVKYYLEGRTKQISNLWTDIDGNKKGSIELKSILDNKVFNNPKPIELIKKILKISECTNNDIILDFFSGSATTAHAVMQLNAEDGKNRQFIMVQLPELCDEKSEAIKAGYKNICEIGKDRIRKASKKIKENDKLILSNLDMGFKVFRLAPSNYKKWQNYTGIDIKEAEDMFSQFESPLIEDWKPENLLTEVMLLEGFQLDSEISSLKNFPKNKVQRVSSGFCEHNLYICLDRDIYAETIKALSLGENDIFICLDNAITDQDKMRLDDKPGRIKTI